MRPVSSDAGIGDGRTRDRVGVGVRVAIAACLALLGLSAAAWFRELQRTVGRAVVVEADARVDPGTERPLRVLVRDRENGALVVPEAAEVRVVEGDAVITRQGVDSGGVVFTLRPGRPGPVRLAATAVARYVEAAPLEFEVQAGEPDELPGDWSGAGVEARREEAQAGVEATGVPGVVGDAPPCPYAVTLIPESGVAVRLLPNRWWVRITAPDGLARAGLAVSVAPNDGGPGATAVTDALGVARLAVESPTTTFWTVDVGGPTPCRHVWSVPLRWDGLVVRPRVALASGPAPRVLEVVQQRSAGRAHWDLYCGVAWVATGESSTPQGASVLELPRPDVREGTLCRVWVRASLSGRSTPYAVGSWVETSSPGVGVQQLAGDLARSAADPVATQAAAWAAAGGFTASQRDDAARWLLNWLPAAPRMRPVLASSAPRDDAAFASRRAEVTRRVVAASSSATLGLFALVGAVLVGGARRQRRALAPLDDREPGEPEELVRDRNLLWGAIGVAVVAVLVAVFALAVPV
jgi:hypothetical protein